MVLRPVSQLRSTVRHKGSGSSALVGICLDGSIISIRVSLFRLSFGIVFTPWVTWASSNSQTPPNSYPIGTRDSAGYVCVFMCGLLPHTIHLEEKLICWRWSLTCSVHGHTNVRLMYLYTLIYCLEIQCGCMYIETHFKHFRSIYGLYSATSCSLCMECTRRILTKYIHSIIWTFYFTMFPLPLPAGPVRLGSSGNCSLKRNCVSFTFLLLLLLLTAHKNHSTISPTSNSTKILY